MAGFTNRGKKQLFDVYFRGATGPTQFKLALLTAAAAPTQDTDTMSGLTEVAAGNGYTAGGLVIERSATGFPTLTEDDTLDLAEAIVKNAVWTANGGTLPSNGVGARYAVLLDDSGTPNVIAYYDLTSPRVVSDGQTLTISSAKLQGLES